MVREHAPDVVFLCSPNNPTGTALDLDVIEAVYDGGPRAGRRRRGVRRVLDPPVGRQRCCPAGNGWSSPARCARRSRSPAARLGYLAADPAVVQALQLVRLPYHLSALTQAAARAALAHADELLGHGAGRRSSSATGWCARSAALGLEVVDSDANFVLFGEFGDQAATWQGLLDRGVLVRDVGLPGLAAGDRRHRGGDHARSSTRCAKVCRRVVTREVAGDAGSATVERTTKESTSSSSSTSTARARPRSTPACRSSTTCSPSSGKHGGFDLAVRTRGDLEVDAHHTVEDTAIALGQALREALGDKAGIRRFGDALVPLDETLVQAAVDLSGRPYLVHDRARGRRADRQLRHDADPAHLGVVHRERRRSACTSGCSPGATRTTSSRRSSRRWPARCATPSPSTRAVDRRPVHQGLAVAVSVQRDPDRASGFLLTVDGTPQSHVDLDDPTYLVVRVRPADGPRRRPGRRAGRARSPSCTWAPARSHSRATSPPPGRAPGSARSRCRTRWPRPCAQQLPLGPRREGAGAGGGRPRGAEPDARRRRRTSSCSTCSPAPARRRT